MRRLRRFEGLPRGREWEREWAGGMPPWMMQMETQFSVTIHPISRRSCSEVNISLLAVDWGLPPLAFIATSAPTLTSQSLL